MPLVRIIGRATPLLLMTVVCIAIACTDRASSIAAPPASTQSLGYPRDDTTDDSCIDWGEYTYGPNQCHEGPLVYGDANWQCPTGCFSLPLTETLSSRMWSSLDWIKVDGDCGSMKTYVSQMLRNQMFRYRSMPAYADTHFSTAPGDGHADYRASIHIDDYKALNYGMRDLALTMAHEGYHGWQHVYNETVARSFAEACVVQP